MPKASGNMPPPGKIDLLCRGYAAGKCAHGRSCRFSHDRGSRAAPDIGGICWEFRETGRCTGRLHPLKNAEECGYLRIGPHDPLPANAERFSSQKKSKRRARTEYPIGLDEVVARLNRSHPPGQNTPGAPSSTSVVRIVSPQRIPAPAKATPSMRQVVTTAPAAQSPPQPPRITYAPDYHTITPWTAPAPYPSTRTRPSWPPASHTNRAALPRPVTSFLPRPDGFNYWPLVCWMLVIAVCSVFYVLYVLYLRSPGPTLYAD